MGGGYIQLVAIGAQDAYIIGNPQISFFLKQSIEDIQIFLWNVSNSKCWFYIGGRWYIRF